MFCHNCGASQANNTIFCAQCGARQTSEEAATGEPREASPGARSALHDNISSAHQDALPATVTRAAGADERHGSRVGTALLWLITMGWVSLRALHASVH